jgi:hypothetical protein
MEWNILNMQYIYMSTDLDIYKQNRINQNNLIFNRTVSQLYSTLLTQIQKVNKSPYNLRTKQILLNSLINQYNNNINNLKTNLNKSIASIRNFLPKMPTISRSKKALLIGINYVGTSNELYGCINDALALKDMIGNKGFTNISLLTDLTPKKPTRSNILEEFKNLLMNCQDGDFLFFSYSGHGSYTFDRNNDELDGRDELIVSSDFKGILDDEFKSLIQTYLKSNVTLFALFDSCFSGSVLDLKYQYLDSLNYDNYTENPKTLDTFGNVIMISGCTDNQTSADAFFGKKANGAMTWSLLESLKENPSCSWRELVKNMRGLLQTSQFEQIPQLSAGTFVDIDKQIFI